MSNDTKTPRKYFTIHRGDAGSEAYRDQYVNHIEGELAKAEAKLQEELRRGMASECNADDWDKLVADLNTTIGRLEAENEHLTEERDQFCADYNHLTVYNERLNNKCNRWFKCLRTAEAENERLLGEIDNQVGYLLSIIDCPVEHPINQSWMVRCLQTLRTKIKKATTDE